MFTKSTYDWEFKLALKLLNYAKYCVSNKCNKIAEVGLQINIL